MTHYHKGRLNELKIKACLLLKDLKSNDAEKADKAANRFAKLPFLASLTPHNIINQQEFIRLKHALWLMALEYHCHSWTELRYKIIYEDCLYYENWSAMLNHWFKDLAEARAFRAAYGGYLLSYRQYYFVCDDDFIAQLALNNFRAEWETIGFDWTLAQGSGAWQRLFEAAKHNYLNRKISTTTPNKSKRPAWLSS
jgi:hypothetical protein